MEIVRIYHECDGCCCRKPWWNLFRCIDKNKFVEVDAEKFDGTNGSTTFSDSGPNTKQGG